MAHSDQKNTYKVSASGGIDYLLALNKKHSEIFDQERLFRELYRVKHPTEIAALKCMDGRVHLPRMTNTPLGIIQPWRNIGGQFNLGWYGFNLAMREWVTYSINRGRRCLVLVTYHFSQSDAHRGCRGFNYDVNAAKKFTTDLRDQFIRVFPGKTVVYPVQIGIETDSESIILHGHDGKEVNLANPPRTPLDALLLELYPDMPEEIINDFIPLLDGNIAHASEVRTENKPVEEAEHREWVLGVGRGFDWLHEINLALLVGPFDPNLPNVIEKAAGILAGNLESGRIAVTKEKGIVLMASGAYRNAGEKTHAIEKARTLDEFAFQIILEKVPSLMPYLQRLVVAVDLDTRKLQVLSRN
jgi:hypothetical protein